MSAVHCHHSNKIASITSLSGSAATVDASVVPFTSHWQLCCADTSNSALNQGQQWTSQTGRQYGQADFSFIVHYPFNIEICSAVNHANIIILAENRWNREEFNRGVSNCVDAFTKSNANVFVKLFFFWLVECFFSFEVLFATHCIHSCLFSMAKH